MESLIIAFSVFAIILVGIIVYYNFKIRKITTEKEKFIKQKAYEDSEIFLQEIQQIKQELIVLETKRVAAQERLEDTLRHETHLIAVEVEKERELRKQQLLHDMDMQAQVEFDKLRDEMGQYRIEQIELSQEVLRKTREEGLEKLRQEHELVLSQMLEERGQVEELLLPLRAELADYKAKREAINQDILRSRALEMEENFHRIFLEDVDKEDIKYLQSIENKINNKDVLRKLIWSAYLLKPTNEMINRVLEGKNVAGIYKITDQQGAVYIGKSTGVKNRWIEHAKSSVKVGSIAQQAIHEAMAKQGIDTFTFELLEECEKNLLNEKEKYYIDFFESNIYGYNRTKGG